MHAHLLHRPAPPPRRRLRVPGLLALAVVVAVALSGCGSSDSGSGSGSGKSTQKIAITIKGDSITPNKSKIDVPVNKPITLSIDSDRAGELHLHSSPEQHIDFDKGTSTKTITLKVPGVVELEEHASDTLLAQLVAR